MALLAIYDATSNGLKSVVTRLTEPTALKLTTLCCCGSPDPQPADYAAKESHSTEKKSGFSSTYLLKARALTSFFNFSSDCLLRSVFSP
jgi:hypothetical protein